MMTTMKATVVREPGPADVLSLEDVPLPEVASNEVLVRVHAAGVNRIDGVLRQGGGLAPPFIPGMDVSGTVEAVGDQADGLAPGDAVHGLVAMGGSGSYAQYAVVDADDALLKPRTADHLHAAAVPLAGLTAWQALFEHGAVLAHDRVLIHGGAGGVGHLAVQLAKRAGARVVTTASTDDSHDLVRQLGADEVIDHGTDDPVVVAGAVDAVIDTVGGSVTDRSLEALRPGGRLVSLLGEPDQERARELDVTATRMTFRPDREQLREIDRLVDAGEVRVVVDETFRLADAARAHRRVEEGHVHGKLVLDVLQG